MASKIDRAGFAATVEGRNKKVHVDATFMNSTLQLTASLELAEKAVKYLPMLSMFAPSAKADFEEAKRHIEQAVAEAKR